MRVLAELEWRQLRQDYHAIVGPWVERRHDRRSRGLKHPLEDFLWEYYSLRGGRLMQWSAGANVVLEKATDEDFPDRYSFCSDQGGRVMHLENWMDKRQSGVKWITNLLKLTQERPPVFACLGLHEWAMVYEEADIRHPQLPLRLGHEETRRVVESTPIQCTHFDAFRFFSQSARPLNTLPLSSEGRPNQEQPGCLHANMDLFKWCMKLQPLVPSALVADCFLLAIEARIVDMRASPYDVSEMGYEPIRIETPLGRRNYVEAQKKIYEAALPLRQRLIELVEKVTEDGRSSPSCMVS